MSDPQGWPFLLPLCPLTGVERESYSQSDGVSAPLIHRVIGVAHCDWLA